MNVVVIGAGVAGLAAAYAAQQRGHDCVWLGRGSGASVATCGALDWDPEPQRSGAALSAELETFGNAVLGWRLPSSGVLLVTPEGQLRPARGAAAGLLDLAALVDSRGASVAVLDPGRVGWDAERVCAGLRNDPLFQRAGLSAVRLSVPLPCHAALSDAQFAQALPPSAELAERVAAALQQLAAQGAPLPKAVLCGPWIYSDVGAAAALMAEPALARLGVQVGETLSPPHGLVGQRFEASRSAFVSSAVRLRYHAARVSQLTKQGERWQVVVEGSQAKQAARLEPLEADRVVLALGGIAGGGILLGASHHAQLGLTLQPAAPLRWRGRPWLAAASETGLDLQAFGLHNLNSVGLEPSMQAGSLRATGDLVADVPRTLLRAAQAGLDALQ